MSSLKEIKDRNKDLVLKKVKIYSFIIFLALCSITGVKAQSDSLQKEKKARTAFVIAGSAGAYVGTMAILASYWYGTDASSDFHFHNDNSQWEQVDKVGHFYSAFQISRVSAGMYRWAHHEQKKAAFYGTLTGIVLMTPIEILDGYSTSYGASSGDLMANLLGAGFFLGQELLWGEDRIKVKFSYSHSEFAAQRPEVLGSGFFERMIKDYNGQTYWLSFDTYLFTHKRKAWTKWFNPAIGYGAEAMVYARDDENRELAGLDSYRQFYFTIDPNLAHLKTKSKFLNTMIFLIDGIKIPSPTLEFSNGQVQFHPLFF